MGTQLLKRSLIALSICSLFFFAACGGDDSAPPPKPPTMNNKNDQQALMDLMAQAQKAKQDCTQDYTPMFLILATTAARPQGQGGGQNNLAALLPQLMQQGQGGQCQNDIMNLMMAFTTIMVPPSTPGGAATPYANDPQARQWMATQLAGVANGIWFNIKKEFQSRNIQLPPDAEFAIQKQLLQSGMALVQNKVIPNLGGLSGAASQAFSQYAGGV